MYEKRNTKTNTLMNECFGHDSLIALATVENGVPIH